MNKLIDVRKYFFLIVIYILIIFVSGLFADIIECPCSTYNKRICLNSKACLTSKVSNVFIDKINRVVSIETIDYYFPDDRCVPCKCKIDCNHKCSLGTVRGPSAYTKITKDTFYYWGNGLIGNRIGDPEVTVDITKHSRTTCF
jgi:hypothetical protein